MQQAVSITSQGQLTIPKFIRDAFGISGAIKAVIEIQGNTIVVRPKEDFWSLEGALKSDVQLSDTELQKARQAFTKEWGKNGSA